MKEGWEYKKLGEICRVINGRAYSKDEMLSQGKYRLLRVGNCFTNDSWYYSDLELEEDKYCDNGDLLYAWSASFGPRIWDGEKVIYHYHIWKMVCSPEIDKYFLCYWLDSDELKKQTMTNLHGATMAHITKRIIENAIVSYPSLSEQKSIVDYLDSAFAKVDAMKVHAEKALNEAKALFQASLKEMLEPKEGWEEKTLGDLVVSNVVGLTRGKVEQGYDKKYPYFKMNNISPDNTLCWDDLICVDANEEELEKYCLQEGDFLFNTRNSKEWVGKSTVYRDYDAPIMLYNNNVMRIRFVNTINPVFIAYSFLADYTKDQLEKIKSGTTNVWAIYYRDLSKILITYPSSSEQQSIVAALDSLKSKVDRLQENYHKISQECDALKQAILRQIFE